MPLDVLSFVVIVYAYIMATITIPKHLAGKKLILVPEEEYNALKRAQPPRVFKTASMTKAQRHVFEKAERDYAAGKFVTLNDLERDLERRR